MENESKLYDLEKAREEAGQLKQRIKNGEARTYSEAELEPQQTEQTEFGVLEPMSAKEQKEEILRKFEITKFLFGKLSPEEIKEIKEGRKVLGIRGISWKELYTLIFKGVVNETTMPQSVISSDEDLRDTDPRPPDGTLALFDRSKYADRPVSEVWLKDEMVDQFGPMIAEFVLPAEGLFRAMGTYYSHDRHGVDPDRAYRMKEIYPTKLTVEQLRNLHSRNSGDSWENTLAKDLLSSYGVSQEDIQQGKDFVRHVWTDYVENIKNFYREEKLTFDEFWDLYLLFASEEIKNSREAAKLTLGKIESWEELNAFTLQEAQKKFKEATNKYWKEFAVSGVLQFDAREGKQVLRPFTDLDGRVALGILKKAGIDTSNLTYVKPGEYLKGAINLDTGDKFGVVYEEPTYTLYFDHHAPGRKEVTSTAEIVYKTMVDLGMLEKTEAIDRLVNFVTRVDNRKFPAEDFLRSPQTILGLHSSLDFQTLLRYFKEHSSPFNKLGPYGLERYGLLEVSKRQQEIVDDAMATLERMEKEGKVIDTAYGKLVVNVSGELAVGSSAAYVKYDGIINFSPFKSFAVTLKEKNFDEKRLREELGDNFLGEVIRGKIWLYNESKPMRLTLEEIIESLEPTIREFEVKPFVLYHVSPVPHLTELRPEVPKYRLREEPEEPTVCSCKSWWECAMLYPHKKPIQGEGSKFYLYQIVPSEISKFIGPSESNWLWASQEYRTTEKVKVIRLGEINLDDPEINKAFSRPCTNCGKPWMYCDDDAQCGFDLPPKLPLKQNHKD